MKEIRLILPLCWILVSCQAWNQSKNDNSSKEDKNREIIISLSKGSCFGSCPVYEIEIFQNKTLVFHGRSFVDSIGTYEISIHDSIYNKILTQSESINFHSIKEDQYFNAYIRDLPMTKIKIYNHVIYYNEEPNKELLDLENEISKIAINKGYIIE